MKMSISHCQFRTPPPTPPKIYQMLPFCQFSEERREEVTKPKSSKFAENALNIDLVNYGGLGVGPESGVNLRALVAQCSATPGTVAATPPCSATPFQTQISVRHLPARGGGGGCDTKLFRGCSATPVLHLQNAIKSRKSAATRVARHV